MTTGPALPLVLASGSPRRRELLRWVVSDFQIVPARIEEVSAQADPPARLIEIASRKAQAVASSQPGVIVAADTAVLLDDQLLGKPRNRAQARAMLERLGGRAHEVFTGLCVTNTGTAQRVTACERTRVWFRALDSALLDWYLATGEWRDKAGAYGIQGHGAVLVERVEGNYHNVMGLPLSRLVTMLDEVGFPWKGA